MSEYSFHVPHNATPGYIEAIMETLASDESSKSYWRYEDVVDGALRDGYTLISRSEPFYFVKQLGIIGRKPYALTDKGRILHSLLRKNIDVFNAIIHFLVYSLWTKKEPLKNCFSWTYRTFVNELWESVRVDIDKKKYAAVLANRAKEEFITKFGLSLRVSLSVNSINGVLNWLEVLEPSCIERHNKVITFTRRTFSSPELMILAIDFLYRQRNADYGTTLFLTEENIETICKVCLLEPSAFESVLKWAIGQFDYLVEGRGGGWGRGIILYQKPKLEDFLG